MSELSAYAPSVVIIRARLAVLVPEPTQREQALWDGLQGALEAYDLAGVSSLSGEGQSRSMNFDALRVQVAEWLEAYEQESTVLPVDADPVLLRTPMGHFVSFSRIPLRC